MRTVNYLGHKVEVDGWVNYLAFDLNGELWTYEFCPVAGSRAFETYEGREKKADYIASSWKDSLMAVSYLQDWSDEPQDRWRYDVENIPVNTLIEAFVKDDVFIGIFINARFSGAGKSSRINSIYPEGITAWKPAKLSEPPKVEWIEHDGNSWLQCHPLDIIEVRQRSGGIDRGEARSFSPTAEYGYRIVKKHGG